ncbi:MAG: glycosyltransferase family 4 protein [Acidimicrobiia bacterium]|nr:glycosyltransferase family 4 protein [Acidimicrobiia bacterium]
MNPTSSSLEILIATTLRDRKVGTGVQTQFSTFRNYLEREGHPVQVVSSFSYLPLVVNPVLAMRKIIRPVSKSAWLRWHRSWHYRYVKAALRRAIEQSPNSVIYAQDPLSAEAALAVRDNGQPVVLAVHSPNTEADEWVDHGVIASSSRMYASMKTRERDLLRRVDKLVFASDLQRTDLMSIYPDIDAVPSIVMPQFVEVPETRGVVTPQRDAVSVGTLESRKNHRFLVNVVAAARTAGHEYTLTIIGEGPERKALEAQIARLDLGGLVSLKGRVGHDIGLELEKHRIYLHASRQESFGLAAVEAMALGMPTIVGDTGVVELLEKGVETCVWNDLDRAQQGAELLISVMTDPQRMAELGRRGQERYESSFSVEAVAPRLLDYLLD